LPRIDRSGRVKRFSNTLLSGAAGKRDSFAGLAFAFDDLVRVLELDLWFTGIEECLIDRTFVIQELSIS